VQVSFFGPVQDVLPLTFFQDGIYISGELWEYWHQSFPSASVVEMFSFVAYDIDDECVEFTRSVAWRGPRPPV
jgi:hypothetical protein